jgi:ferritin-like metal-binding protein YciE
MGELDGVWDVERTGGVLPPLVAVRKEIDGDRGATYVGAFVAAPFDVRDRELHYRGLFSGFVDRLTPDGEQFRGRATFKGKEFGTFVMRRKSVSDLKSQLVQHIDEAYAMEQNVLRMLDGMISTTEDPEIRRELEHHKAETEGQAERLKARLEAHDASPSMVREAGGVLGALMKSVADVVRSEKAGRNARDGFATEHMEIASYELLERIARRAGDEETARVAEENKRQEEEMARKLASHWDRFAELSLREAGVSTGAA